VVEWFVDRSSSYNTRETTTGQLKEGLREFMKRHPYVAKHMPAEETDGGDAFTQARLK